MAWLVCGMVEEEDAVADDVAEGVFDAFVLNLGIGGEEGAKAGDLVFHSDFEDDGAVFCELVAEAVAVIVVLLDEHTDDAVHDGHAEGGDVSDGVGGVVALEEEPKSIDSNVFCKLIVDRVCNV